MSVAIHRSPIQSTPFHSSRFQNFSQQQPRTAPANVPGIIHIPTTVKDFQHQPRQSRTRQRKQQQQQDRPKVDPETKDDVRAFPVGNNNSSPKRSPNKDASTKKPSTPASTTRRQPSRSPKLSNKAAQAVPVLVDNNAVSDQTHPQVPYTPSPSKKRPQTAPTTPRVDTEPSPKPTRPRRGGHPKPNNNSVTSSFGAMPIPTRRASSHGVSRSTPTADPFLSRSVPSSSNQGALPDWDLPPTFSSRTEQVTAVESSPTPPRFDTSAPNLVPWLETHEDEFDAPAPATVDRKSQSQPNLLSPQEPVSPTRRSGRSHRHTRTASVPSLSMGLFAHLEQTGSHDPAGKDSKNSKYAGGRFQSAPAPTFLPMPSFQA